MQRRQRFWWQPRLLLIIVLFILLGKPQVLLLGRRISHSKALRPSCPRQNLPYATTIVRFIVIIDWSRGRGLPTRQTSEIDIRLSGKLYVLLLRLGNRCRRGRSSEQEQACRTTTERASAGSRDENHRGKARTVLLGGQSGRNAVAAAA